MPLNTGQQLRTEQRQKLSPQMFKAMEILQMPTWQLDKRIEQELEANPVLDLDKNIDNENYTQKDDVNNAEDNKKNQQENKLAPDINPKYWQRKSGNTQNWRDPKMDAMANTPARSESLYEQLIDQWALVETAPNIKQAGKILISFIDKDGYIRESLDEILKSIKDSNDADNIDKSLLNKALDLLQQNLEPVGLGSQNARQCLLLQIDAKNSDNPKKDLWTERLLVDKYLKDVESNRLEHISKSTGLDLEKIKNTINNLKQFYFHPGQLLSSEQAQTIRADINIEYDIDLDKYIASLISNSNSALYLNEYYKKLASSKDTDKKTKDFIKNNINSGQQLINAIAQRQNTLLKVSQVATDKQKEFLDKGPEYIKPLSMENVADELGIHAATVSRAVNEKYAQTQRGIIPLRMFFSGGKKSDTGEQISWRAIEQKIKDIVDTEDKNKPFNDDELSDELKKQNITLARRTIAKYRKQLSIPAARQRKEY